MASLKERKDCGKKKWKVSFTYYDQFGNRKRSSKSFEKKKDAEAFKSQKNKEEQKGFCNKVYIDTFNSLIDIFLESYGKWKWAPSTYAKNKNQFNNYIRPVLGEIPVKDINLLLLQKFFIGLRNTKVVPRPNAKGPQECLSENNIFEIYKRLNKCFRYAEEQRWIEESPMKYFSYPKPENIKGEEDDENKIWETEEIKIALSKTENRQLYLLMNLAFLACTRVGELTGIRYDQIKFHIGENEPTVIRITQEVIRLSKESISNVLNKSKILYQFPNGDDKKTALTICTPKTKGSIRTIFVPDKVAIVIKEEIEYIKSISHRFKKEDRDQHLLFVNYETGRPYEKNAINKMLEKFCKENNLKVITSHSFRHMGVQETTNLTTDVKSIQALTGHITPNQISKTYSHKQKDKRLKLFKAVENEFYSETENKGNELSDSDVIGYLLKNEELLETVKNMFKNEKNRNGSQNGSRD